MPHNSPTGFVTAFFAVVTGFAMIWHIWWMAGVGIAGAFATFVVFAWRDKVEYELPAEEVARVDALRREAREDLVAGREPGIHPVRVAEKEDQVGLGIRDRRGGHEGPASKRIVTGYGFWVFLLSDFVMFSAFYATYAVLVARDGGRPRAARPLQPENRGGRDGLSAAVELRLRLGDDRQQRPQHAVDPGRLRRHGPARARLPRTSRSMSSRR